MRSHLIMLAMAGSLALAPAWGALAQVTEPADGLSLRADRYRGVVGRPPAPGSAAEAEDLAVLRWNLRSRYPAAVMHSWRFLNRNLSSFDAALGADLSKNAPMLFKGLPSFLKQTEVIKDVLKEEIARPRPYTSFPDLQPCLPLETTFSYPSGHATWYATASLLLADLLPDRRERLLEIGRQGGFARAYCAVHYPSDVLASQRLAEALSRDVIASPQWQLFKQQLGPELKKLLVAPPAGIPMLSE